MTSKPVEARVVASVRKDIASMKTRGAGEIGRQAALALAEAAQSFPGSDLKRFQSELVEAAQELASARPTAVTLRNGLNELLSQSFGASDVASAKAAVRKAAKSLESRLVAEKKHIAERGARLLGKGECVLTHCHSTAVLGVLLEAHGQGKAPRVIATETRPFRQGLLTAPALQRAGVDVSLIVDSAALHVMEKERVAKVLLGADAVAADGSVYNKIGTRMVTLAAKTLGVPVYVCAEAAKFSPYTLDGEPVIIEERAAQEVAGPDEAPGVRVLNPVFDRTPPDQVTQFVTGEGTLPPSDIRGYIERTYKGVRRWI